MMDARLQVRVQRYGWDAAASWYQDGWQVQLRPAHDTLIEMAFFSPGMNIIETACGTGLVTSRIADLVSPNGRVLATDLSQSMIDTLDRSLSTVCDQHIQTERMEADRLNVSDSEFDGAIYALGVMYMPDPRAAVIELARVVKPDGVVATTVWGERQHCGWADVFPIVDARVALQVCPLFFSTGWQGCLAADFEAAGLQQIEERRQIEVLRFSDDLDVITAVLLGGPVALAVKRFTDQIWNDVKREFLQSVIRFRTSDGGYEIPGEFVSVCGKCR